MKLLIVFTLIAYSLAEFNSFEEFSANNGNKGVEEYALELGFKTFSHEFNKFKIDNNKKYDSEGEEEKRKFNFLKNLQFVEQHNELYKKGEATHEAGINLFSDLTIDEYHNSFTMPMPVSANVSKVGDQDDVAVYVGLPANFDWRSSHKITPIKNQAQCGSCWAFSTVASVEAQYLIRHNQRVGLSEQQLVDCHAHNCGGQTLNGAYDYIHSAGLESDNVYPYRAKAGNCQNNNGRAHIKISGYRTLGKALNGRTADDNTIMNAIQTHGPLAIVIDASGDDFMHYRGGVLTSGGNQLKSVHAVLLIGWGPNFWIIKNSWGTTWGEAGFGLMKRGGDFRAMNDFLYYPVL